MIKKLLISFSLVLMLSCSKNTEQDNIKLSSTGKFSIKEVKTSNHQDYRTTLDKTYIIEPITDKPLKLNWRVTKEKFPTMWDIAFCDNAGCHLEFPDTCELDFINRSDDTKHRSLSLIVETNEEKGKGELEIVIWEAKFKETDTLVFEVEFK